MKMDTKYNRIEWNLMCFHCYSECSQQQTKCQQYLRCWLTLYTLAGQHQIWIVCSLFFLNFPSIHKCCTSSTDRDCNCCCCFVRPFFVAVVVVVVDFCLLAKLIFAPISLLMFFLCVGYARFGTLVNGIFGAAPLCIMSILLTLTTFQMYRSTINWIDIWIYRHSIYTFLEA